MVDYRHCRSSLKKAHQEKKHFKKKKKEWDNTLDRTMPEEAYIHSARTKYNEHDKRRPGRNHSREVIPDQKHRDDVTMPKPVKHKTSRGKMSHGGSRHRQANAQAAQEIGRMFSSSRRDSLSPTRSYLSGPSTMSHRGMDGTSQSFRLENLGPPGVLVNSASFLESEHGSIFSPPGGSSAPSIQRHATGASSHRSRRRRNEHPVEDVSPLSSVVELSHLTPHPRAARSPSPLSQRSYGGRAIPDIALTPCGSNLSSIISQTNHRSHPVYQSDRESLTSQNTFYTAFWGDGHRPTAG